MTELNQNYTWDPDHKEVCMKAPRLTFTKQDLLDMARAMPQPERPQEHQIPDDRIQAWAGTDGKLASLEIHVDLLRDFLLAFGIYTMTADELLEKNPIISSLEAQLKDTRIKLDARISEQRETLRELQRGYDAQLARIKQMNDTTQELATTKAQLKVVTEQCRLEIESRNALTKVFNEKMEEDPYKRANDLECKTSDLSAELDKSRKWAILLEDTNRALKMRLNANEVVYNQLGRRLQAMRAAASMCNLRSELGILIDDIWP